MTAAPPPPKPPPTTAIEGFIVAMVSVRLPDQADQGRRERGVLCTRATEDADMRRSADLAAVIAEWLVALPHRLLEARFGGATDEAVALLGVAGDAVEEGAEQLRLVQTLRVERLVDEHLHHHQLVDPQPCDPLQQRLEALVELIGRRRLGRQPPLLRLLAAQRVAGQQQPLGP